MDSDETSKHVDDVPGADAAVDFDGQTFTGPFINDGQTFKLLAIGTSVEDEIVRPHVVGRRRGCRSGSAAGNSPPGPAPRHLQPCLSPQSVCAVSAHHKSAASQEHLDATVTIPRVLSGEIVHRLDYRGVFVRQT